MKAGEVAENVRSTVQIGPSLTQARELASPGGKTAPSVLPLTEKIQQAGKNKSTATFDAAKITGTNAHYVADAKRLKAESPQLFEKVKSGETTVSLTHARQLLRVGERRFRDLVREGRVALIGQGHGRRVTQNSLFAELSKRNSALTHQSVTKSGNHGQSLPNLWREHSDSNALTAENYDMYRSITQQIPDRVEPIGELLSIASAAAAVGLSQGSLKRLVETGRLPSVLIGDRRRVNREILRAWARGEQRR